MRAICWILLLLFVALLGACRSSYLDELHEGEKLTLKRFIESQGVKPWEYRDVFLGVQEAGDSLRVVEGDTLYFRYTLYALGSGERVIESNDTVVVNQHKLGRVSDTAFVYIIGRTRTVNGLDMALRQFARRHSKIWVGVPSSLGYGGRQVGDVRPYTPLCYQLQIGWASSKVIK